MGPLRISLGGGHSRVVLAWLASLLRVRAVVYTPTGCNVTGLDGRLGARPQQRGGSTLFRISCQNRCRFGPVSGCSSPYLTFELPGPAFSVSTAKFGSGNHLDGPNQAVRGLPVLKTRQNDRIWSGFGLQLTQSYF